MDVEHRTPLLVARLVQHAVPRETGVQHEVVDSAELCHGEINDPLHVCLVCDVAGEGHTASGAGVANEVRRGS